MNGISVDESRAIDTSLIAVRCHPGPVGLFSTHRFSLQAIDTGTSLIYVPDSVADDFYAQVRGSTPTKDTDSEYLAQIPGSRKVVQFGPSMNLLRSYSHRFSRTLADFHSFPCASKIAPSLTFNDYRFTLDLRDFNLGKTGYGSP